jgi:hypothetical protein
MKAESLDELKAAFAEWRRSKSHVREAAPQELLTRARKATGVHGVGKVSRATRVDRRRLEGVPRVHAGRRARPTGAPSFSRVELVAPARSRPFAEVELGTGLKVRFFEQTPEALGLLSSLCGAGGGR